MGDYNQRDAAYSNVYSNPLDLSSSGNTSQGYSESGYASGGQMPSAAGYGQAPPNYGQASSNFGSGSYDNMPRPTGQYKFSAEEQRLLKECNSESFYKRSLPIMAALSAATHFAVKSGKLKPHPMMGSFPKVAMASLLGWFAGKMSYYKTCEEKFLTQLPNSHVATNIRNRRQGITEQPTPPPWQQTPPPWQSTSPSHENTYSTTGGPAVQQRTFGAPLGGPSQGDFSSYGRPTSQQNPNYNVDDYVSNIDVDSEMSRNNDLTDDHRGDHSLDNESGSSSYSRDDDSRPMSVNYDDVRRQHRDVYFKGPQRGSEGPRQSSGF